MSDETVALTANPSTANIVRDVLRVGGGARVELVRRRKPYCAKDATRSRISSSNSTSPLGDDLKWGGNLDVPDKWKSVKQWAAEHAPEAAGFAFAQ